LTILFGTDKVLAEGENGYGNFTGGYWSAQQGSLQPSCVFKPTKTVEVSTLVLAARLYQCPFAVKGGGHAAWAGASSIEDGITVLLEEFKQAVVASDKQTVDIGPGLRWIDVYQAVEKDGLSVAGGRVSLRLNFNDMALLLISKLDGACRRAWTYPRRWHIPLRKQAWMGVR
jgi:FAD/FMN-containing dehydrogenase